MSPKDRLLQAQGLDKAFDYMGIGKNILQARAGGLAVAGKIEGDPADRVSQEFPEKSEPTLLAAARTVHQYEGRIGRIPA
jgi:hypothetical protein